jgi:hypothetical protein
MEVGPMGRPVSKQHERLERASKTNKDAAQLSASWGKFQVMGFNSKACGSAPLQDFVDDRNTEDDQLLRFTHYISSSHLDDELHTHGCTVFALAYTGPFYRRNHYDVKLKTAYTKFKTGVTA